MVVQEVVAQVFIFISFDGFVTVFVASIYTVMVYSGYRGGPGGHRGGGSAPRGGSSYNRGGFRGNQSAASSSGAHQ